MPKLYHKGLKKVVNCSPDQEKELLESKNYTKDIPKSKGEEPKGEEKK